MKSLRRFIFNPLFLEKSRFCCLAAALTKSAVNDFINNPVKNVRKCSFFYYKYAIMFSTVMGKLTETAQ